MESEAARKTRPARSYAAVLAAAAFALGVYIAPSIEVGLWLIAPPVLLIALIPLYRRYRVRLMPLIILLVFALGMGRGCLSLKAPDAPVGKKLTVIGTVYGDTRRYSDGRVSFMLSGASIEGEKQHTKVYATIYPKSGETLASYSNGTRVSVTGTVYHPGEKRGEHDFDFRMWLYQQGAKLGVTASGSPEILSIGHIGDPFHTLREWLIASLERVMGDDARLPVALLLGQRGGMDKSEIEAFRELGVAHLMSVSGLHVSMLGGMILWLLRRLRVKPRSRLIIILLFMLLYSLLTGFSAATQRACVMLITAMAARLLSRRPDPIVALSVAMLAVLILDPLELFSAGFALSFAATAAILLLYDPLRSLLPDTRSKAINIACDALCVSVAASAGVAIPTANTFHRLPAYGVLINVLFVPLMGFMMPMYFATLLLSPIPYIGDAIGFLARFPTRGFLWLTQLMSTLPYASMRVPSVPAIVSIAASLCVLVLSRYVRASALKRLASIAIIASLAVGGALISRPASLRYIQLSCGQADAALILTRESTIAIDVSDDGGEAAGWLLAENRNIDALFLTHLHIDHAGGVKALIDEGIAIKRAYIPEAADRADLSEDSLLVIDILKSADIPISELAAGDSVWYDRGAVTVLWPEPGKVHFGKDANETAMALRVTMDDFTLLSCSDITGDYERYFAQGCDILKVAHHGSADSTSLDFLRAAAPQIALISCGATNDSLPAAETLERLTQLGIPCFRTDEAGDITLSISGDKLILDCYRGRREP